VHVKPDRKFLLAHPAHFVALGFGSGLAPNAPGTFGTLAALPIWWLASHVGGAPAVIASAALLFALGVWACAQTGRALGVVDHGSIVIDEIAAFLLVLAVTPEHPAWLLAAFALFRLFDIWKPWPIRLADQRIKNAFGVMFDDLLAAGYAIAVILIVQSLLVVR
jgi:phosphatidylglycerophosphatase A